MHNKLNTFHFHATKSFIHHIVCFSYDSYNGYSIGPASFSLFSDRNFLTIETLSSGLKPAKWVFSCLSKCKTVITCIVLPFVSSIWDPRLGQRVKLSRCSFEATPRIDINKLVDPHG